MFRGDLTDISAEKEALVSITLIIIRVDYKGMCTWDQSIQQRMHLLFYNTSTGADDWHK